MSPSPLQQVPPPYRQIADYYAAKIKAGQIKPGEFLPPATEIMETWGVSKATAGKATDRMKTLGLIETVPARGLRVVARPGVGVNESLTPPAPAETRRRSPAPGPASPRRKS